MSTGFGQFWIGKKLTKMCGRGNGQRRPEFILCGLGAGNYIPAGMSKRTEEDPLSVC
jgi:hypothetical protein